MFLQLVNLGYRLAPRLCPRPIILLDSQLKQLEWFGFGIQELQQEALKNCLITIHHRVSKQLPEYSVTPDGGNDYRFQGDRLFAVIEYSLCMSLEVARHEFDLGNVTHSAEAARWIEYARSVERELKNLFQYLRPRAVVYSQGCFVESMIASELSSHLGFQTFALENTFFPERMICEPSTGLSVNINSAMEWYQKHGAKGGDVNWMRTVVERIDSVKQVEHASGRNAFDWPTGRRRILFLGQCYTDSAVLFGAFGEYSAVEVVQSLVRYASDQNAFVLVKLHPKENGARTPLGQPYNRLTSRKLAGGGIADGPACFIDVNNENSTQRLMRDADVIVTINSQGGLEAQAFGKEVILLGKAFYDGLNTTWNLSDPKLLPMTLDAILCRGEKRANASRTAAFFRNYYECYCIGKNSRSLAVALHQRLKPE